MIPFFVYILCGIFTTYITGAIMHVKETDFDKSDMAVWFSFWPVIILGHIFAWAIVKEDKK